MDWRVSPAKVEWHCYNCETLNTTDFTKCQAEAKPECAKCKYMHIVAVVVNMGESPRDHLNRMKAVADAVSAPKC